MIDQSLVSVILPTHNRAILLPRAIRSVLNQSYSSFELLIIDDASTDNTSEVVSAFNDSRIKYIYRHQNGGAAATRNSGIKLAQGEYIALLDDDDEYLPEFLSESMKAWAIAPSDVGVSWCGRRIVSQSAKGEVTLKEGAWQPNFASKEDAYKAFLRARQVGTAGGMMIRRQCFDDIGLFDENFSKAEDTDFLIRLVRKYEFIVIPSVLIKVYEHGGEKLTRYDHEMAQAYELIIEKHINTLESDAALWTDLHYQTGWAFYHGNDRKQARRHLGLALKRTPLHLKAWIILVLFELLGHNAVTLHRSISIFRTGVRDRIATRLHLKRR